MKTNRQRETRWKALAVGAAGILCACASSQASVITFDSQASAGTPFLGEFELGYTVTPMAMNSFFYSGPVDLPNSIYLSPDSSADPEAIEVTDGGAAFDFSSAAFASRSSGSGYFYYGYSGSTLVFTESGNLNGSNSLLTIAATAADSAKPITALEIEIIPGAKTTAVNVNDINVSAVPEPMTTSLLGLGGVAVAAYGLRRRRA